MISRPSKQIPYGFWYRAPRSRVTLSPFIASNSKGFAHIASAQDPKPPVALFGLDGTYASALYTAAVKSSTLDSTGKSLASLREILKNDPKLSIILNAPTLTLHDKSQIVDELHKHTGTTDKGDIVRNFLKTLAENNRLGLLDDICEKFGTLTGAASGQMDLIVISAAKLDTKTLQRLETAVAKSDYSQGMKLKVVAKVNPGIIGGLIIEIGDRTIDLSVSSKIAKMNKMLQSTL